MIVVKALKKIMNQLPYVRGLYQQTRNAAYPNGHFYSPVVSIDEVKKRESEIWKNVGVDGIKGIDLRTESQLALVSDFESYYKEMPFTAEKQPNLRYQFDNGFYSYTDATMLYSMIRHFKPKQIIEIGSGFSSAVMLDTNQVFFNDEIKLTFIDPYATRLYSLMTEADKKRVEVIEKDVQVISLGIFEKLEAGDILFVDSTHVAKTGSDVNHILFEILPVLKKGVLIHFHDIFYPFEYPKEWVFKGFNWNEDYIVKAFLMYNEQFQIRLFSQYLHLHHKDAFKNMPVTYKNPGGNLWIQKM